MEIKIEKVNVRKNIIVKT